MTFVVTGATGKLGRLTVEALLAKNIPAEQIVAGGRDLTKLADFADRGVHVRRIDYDDPDSLHDAFSGADKILLVSGTDVGRRVQQHRNAIEAAGRAGVKLVAYTSVPHADTTTLKLGAEHRATEEVLRSSGVPFAMLRNSWYLENYTEQLETFLEYGVIVGNAGDGPISAATRADYAEAAAEVLIKDGQAGKVYELGSDHPFTMSELAEQVSTATGRPIEYRDLPTDDYTQALIGAGLPEDDAEMLADSGPSLARGDLLVAGDDLRTLIGRPTTTMPEAVRETADALVGSRD
ncbi:SDR family oxidoreductase [Spelaeicoccus albus]|uniref:NAD(P)H dehydrogenase (Quinone) n=1 Tax=Spelaeicoccus albus TaxID=1280376 RepID=A0A7Z0AAD8_9MICO|nr:SDR family oxidoreductase [Spelaeicoccus albus]NYI66480.1 NAD(P)H dehydrogenase (quinone) [Spelaeicoccus albus]